MIFLRVEKQRTAGVSKSSRYRVTLRASHNAPPVFTSNREFGSVAHAKADAEAIFGALRWTEDNQAAIIMQQPDTATIAQQFSRGTPGSAGEGAKK